MAETHDAETHGPAVNMYWVIFAALSVFTIISFVVNGAVRAEPPMLTAQAGFLLIMGVAVCKAVLVGLIFMHLKWDWGRLYFMIIPALILGALLIVVLLPDIVLGWHMEQGAPTAAETKSQH